ncbi:MAG: hypothetical protein ABIQ86_06645 [Steroidobacteraceae bacterium]
MLGRFLELALVVDDPGAAWLRYQQHGFAPAQTGDMWNHAYGVVACRGFALGLHARGVEDFSIVFVRPEVAALHRDLTERGLQIEQARLGSDVFNELTLREPSGKMLRVLEARSFSPPAELPSHTRFGSFTSLSLPCRDLAKAADFWRQMGLTVDATEVPWDGFTVPGTPLAYHARRVLPEPALLFQRTADRFGSGSEVGGLQLDSPLGALGGQEHSLLRTPENMAVLVLG